VHEHFYSGAFLGFADGGGNEARRAESGSGFLGGGSQPLSHQLEGLGERCKLPSGVRVGAPAAKRCHYILSAQDGLS